jgi:hypothetical protein
VSWWWGQAGLSEFQMPIEKLGMRRKYKERKKERKKEEMKKQTLTLNVACLQKFLAFSITGTY